jgi:2'-5' RNA ligase
MPRLFTAIEIPHAIASDLALYRGGLPGARWIEPENYHVTLRFIGDVDGTTAREVAATMAESPAMGAPRLVIDGLGSFGGDRPRALFARVAPSAELSRLQAAQEKLARRAGLEPETRKFTPHVTLARLRGVRSGDLAALIARAGHFPPLVFTAERFVLMSARESVGGGPYLVEAAYPFAQGAPALSGSPGSTEP